MLKPPFVAIPLLSTRGHIFIYCVDKNATDNTVLMAEDSLAQIVIPLYPTRGALPCVLHQGLMN